MVRKSLPGDRKMPDYDRCLASIDVFFSLRGGKKSEELDEVHIAFTRHSYYGSLFGNAADFNGDAYRFS